MTKINARVLLVHGAYHDAWCWNRVTPYLDKAGIPWLAPDLPLRGFRDDGDIVRSYIDQMEDNVVVVGHSRGGIVITIAAAGTKNIGHLICIASNLPRDGELRYRPSVLRATAVHVVEDPNGASYRVVDQVIGRQYFYDDCDDALVDEAMTHLRHSMTPLDDIPLAEVDMSVLKEIPSTYVICTQDRAQHPDDQREMAEMLGESIEIASSHSAMFSHPESIAKVIIDRVNN